jgi:hypothetical protein
VHQITLLSQNNIEIVISSMLFGQPPTTSLSALLVLVVVVVVVACLSVDAKDFDWDITPKDGSPAVACL